MEWKIELQVQKNRGTFKSLKLTMVERQEYLPGPRAVVKQYLLYVPKATSVQGLKAVAKVNFGVRVRGTTVVLVFGRGEGREPERGTCEGPKNVGKHLNSRGNGNGRKMPHHFWLRVSDGVASSPHIPQLALIALLSISQWQCLSQVAAFGETSPFCLCARHATHGMAEPR